MLDFLFTQSPIVAIVISGFLALGFDLLLVYWRIKIITLGPRSRKKVGIAAAVVSIFVGLIIFSLTVITAFRLHASLFHHIWFAVEILLMTSLFTWLVYISTSRALKQIRILLGRTSNGPFTEQRQSYQQPGLGDEMAPPHQTSRSRPQLKEAREEEQGPMER